MRQTDVWFGILGFCGAIIILIVAIPMGIPDRVISGISIRMFPKTIVTLIAILSLMLVVQRLIWPACSENNFTKQELPLDALMLLTLPVSYLIVKFLGIPAFALVATPIAMWVYGDRSWLRIGITAVSFAVLARVVVVHLLQRPPLGIF
ncbi:tripartite tricarboxylate transporter TctB family protein [Sulfitobacter sp. 20_GPM-1509m]|uniref:tripartite tricarboxylate transporter TctB family protein n=1 Tax=Sulfitobacter sp. 20_GPM-1509m TaxID=1380367 RepID=UPI00048BF447|nr:tripartite tricarboxylate transporter TctB family protein [Sulfitobacter sp. 20_GPM-1509m]